jgi:hypothetical protein
VTVSIPPELWARCKILAGGGREGPRRFATCVPVPAQFAQLEYHLRVAHQRLRAAPNASRLVRSALITAGGIVAHSATIACELAVPAGPLRDSIRNRTRLARRADIWFRDHLSEPGLADAFKFLRRFQLKSGNCAKKEIGRSLILLASFSLRTGMLSAA